MDILQLLTEQLTKPYPTRKMGQSVDAKPSQVKQLAQIGVPLLLQALSNNASTKQGVNSLATALDEHKDDDVSSVSKFLNNVDTSDGAKMLQHILGSKGNQVQNNLAKQTGLNKNQVFGLLVQLAPLVIGALGQEKKEKNLDASAVPSLLNGLLQQTDSGGLVGLATMLLASDQGSSLVSDVGNMIKGMGKK